MKKILIFCAVILLWPKLVLGEFINNGNSTVTDTITGLMWEVKTDDGGSRDKDNTHDWEGALSYCENLTLVGYNDWRLPDRNELQSLVDYTQYGPCIDTIYFPNTVSSNYWSSTTYAGNTFSAWGVSFSDGGVGNRSKSGGNYVRAVRGGQCGSFGLFVPLLDQRDYDQTIGTCECDTSTCVNCPVYNPHPYRCSIHEIGCAITSLTMVMQYYNVNDLA